MPERITLPIARDLLKRAMETQGREFVYGTDHMGYYVPQDNVASDDPRSKTGCLVGVALALHGYTTEQLEVIGDVKELAQTANIDIEGSALDYFDKAQDSQDDGHTWGAAYDTAEWWADQFEQGWRNADA